MAQLTELQDLVACPRCDAPLALDAQHFRCGACRVNFPVIDELPWLFAEPGAAQGEWQARIHHELRRLEARVAQLQRELTADDLLDATTRRLGTLRDACEDQHAKLSALLAPVLAGSAPAARETYLALRTRLPTDQGLNTYYQNLHRDWCWGEAENDAAVEILGSLLDASPGNTLVLGAGGGRLCYDLHRLNDGGLTLGLDFNPLLLGVARRAAAGETVALWEFPLAPRAPSDSAVLRQLQAGTAPPGLHFLLGDVLRPPFTAGCFDRVITPWLVDILPVELGELARRINGLLKPAGQWLNFGSLAFDRPAERERYSFSECAELLTHCGFGELRQREDEIPYMCSPASRHGRRELVCSFRAQKTASLPAPARHSALPEWLVTGREPVPAMESFQRQAASTRILAYVMGLIDGRRSIRDMAALLESQRLMQQQEAEGVIRDFLIRMYEESQRDFP